MASCKSENRPVIVAGAGPVGLAAAVDLARQGVAVVVLDDGDGSPSAGSRAICFAKRTIEILDRLGCGERVAAKGVQWNTGRVFLRDQPIYSFDLLPEPGHQRPAFVNIQQYYVEDYLIERARELPLLDLRWEHRVVGVAQGPDGMEVEVETGGRRERLRGAYLVAADGSRSAIRSLLGHESRGRTFRDRFLIADVRMQAAFPAERWFWFDPPFHPGQSVLLHRQPDDVWRIDFQLGWDADPAAERQPERVIPRVRALLEGGLGKAVPFELEWVSVYTFSCQRMARFRDGRVLFAGDSAHGVSPFGARGANSGIQDADNLAWKLRLVLDGHATDALLDSYAAEREFAADENILHSTRSTDFITPKSPASRVFRDAVLELARDCAFARRMVNSGRLSTPATLARSPLNTPDEDEGESAFAGGTVPGAPCADAPVRAAGRDGWLLPLLGDGFALLRFGDGDDAGLGGALPLRTVRVGPPGSGAPVEEDGTASRRYDARPGTTYLVRPDQHVCARWRAFDPAKVGRALARALGR